MSKFYDYLKQFDITTAVTDEDVEKALALLQLYAPTMRRAGSRISEMEEECFDSHRKTVADFIDLAIDFDHETDRKRIADRLAEMGHSMQLLELMEEALCLVKTTPKHGTTYFEILGIASSTFYRHIKPAIRAFAANLWCVVIPDLIIAEQKLATNGSSTESQMGDMRERA